MADLSLWALAGSHRWAGSARRAISRLGDGERREFMLCTKRIWQGVLWIATSAMFAFSHEGEGRTSFVCATMFN
jgi:hypothetical protein